MSNQNILRKELASFERLFRIFEAQNKKIYAVGGCVRDAIMGLEAQDDFDFTTDALPKESEQILKSAGFHTYNVGVRFGTIATHIRKTSVEITTFRVAEVYEQGNRKPHVTFGSEIRDDLSRRDLSINAMAGSFDGTIIDPFGGQEDILSRTLRVPGGGFENTLTILNDDPLRILRIARFAARFNFLPTEETTKAATQVVSSLQNISRERWRAELEKTFLTPHLRVGIQWLIETGALKELFPAFLALKSSFSREFVSQIVSVKRDSKHEQLLRWGILVAWALMLSSETRSFSSIPTEQRRVYAGKIAQRFRFSKFQKRRLINVLCFPFDSEMLKKRWLLPQLRRWVISFGPDLAMAQIRLFQHLNHEDERAYQNANILQTQLSQLLASEDPIPRLPVGIGRKLLELTALKKGPAIGLAIQQLQDAIIEGAIPNHPSIQQCIQYIEAL